MRLPKTFRAPHRVPAAGPAADLHLIERLLPPLRLLRRYCRLTVEGIDRIPPGPAILAPNHTGWLGLDYMNLASCVYDGVGRLPNVAVHRLWFARRRLAEWARRLGLVPAEKDAFVPLLAGGGLVTIFPEGEAGAFKPAGRDARYRLQEFKRGFVRAAMASRAPIVPVAVIGGEEANPCLYRIKATRRLFGLALPLPVNLFPLPVKWRVSFLDPIPMDRYSARDAGDRALVHRIARRVQAQVQREVSLQLEKRGPRFG